jgi:hypothetical protein
VRASRALFASLGASLSLVLAGSLALATISTVVAFQGWPGVASGQRSVSESQLQVASAPASVTRATALMMTTRRPRPAAPAHQEARRAPVRTTTAPPAQTASRDVAGSKATQAHPASAPASATLSGAGPSRTTTKPKKVVVPVDAEPVRRIGNDLGSVVAGAGQGLGDSVSQLSPELGKVVSDVTTGVGTTVAATTQLVADVLDALAPKK